MSRRPLLPMLVMAITFSWSSLPAEADVIGDAAVLDDVFVAYETNMANLRTWQAEMEIHDSRSVHDLSGTATNAVSLSYDRDQSASLVHWRCIGFDFKRGGKALPSLENREKVRMIVDQTVTTILGFDRTRMSGPTIVIGKPMKPRAAGLFEDRLVPAELFWYQNEPASDRLRKMVDIAKTRDGKLTITKQDRHVVLRSEVTLRRPYDFKETDDLTIDLSKGGMIVSARIHSIGKNDITTRLDTDYEYHNGVWVPKIAHRSQFVAGGKNAGERRREIVWKSNKVNEEIDHGQFTVDALRGDRPATLVDRRAMTQIRLDKDGRPVVPRSKTRETTPETKNIAKAGAVQAVGRLYNPYTFSTLFLIVVAALRALPAAKKTSKPAHQAGSDRS